MLSYVSTGHRGALILVLIIEKSSESGSVIVHLSGKMMQPLAAFFPGELQKDPERGNPGHLVLGTATWDSTSTHCF